MNLENLTPFFSLLQPKYLEEKCRHSPLGLGRDDPSSLSKVNGCAALFQVGAEGYLGEAWAAALPCPALPSCLLLMGNGCRTAPASTQAFKLLP